MPEKFENKSTLNKKSSSSSILPVESSSENASLNKKPLIPKSKKHAPLTHNSPKTQKPNSSETEDEFRESDRPKHKKLKKIKPRPTRINDGSLADSEREESEIRIQNKFK